MSLTLQPVGVVHGGLPPPGSDKPRPTDFSELEGRIEVFPEYAPALDGIDGFSHLFILSHLDRQKAGGKGLLRVSPRLHRGSDVPVEKAPEVGVFATDSPARPNPIGLTLVRLVARQGNVLIVQGVDVYDGTPVLDLKPYRADYKAERHVVPRWATEGDPERNPL
ncbi:MAG TPA: tRNA (N6-threonylcarbamoyladenosine(37)-N6)-methyltransferase TrmO [Thermoplasmata archaeon]|nr:tRNA (N6-threonylcarbamoyladenosine(37)-N6)-methyltransferase TrmO [Thermoplasmata archaeon]